MFRVPFITSAWFMVSAAMPLARADAARRAKYVEGDVIVTFRASTTPETAEKKLTARSIKLSRHFRHLSESRKQPVCLASDRTRSTAALIKELQADPSVESVEPDYLRWTTANPDDTRFSELWGLQNTGQSINGTSGSSGADIRFPPAWNLRKTDAGTVVIGVMDTGCDYTHPDLADNIWINPGEIAGNATDDDSNGHTDDVYGYNFSAGDSNAYDSGSHGTHVAGTIAAAGFNQRGIIGVNSLARLMSLKVSNDGDSISTSAVIAGLQYATTMKNRGVNIVAINASFGGGGYSSAERSAILAAGGAGIVFCAAAGNESSNNNNTLTYPASYRLPNMVVVAATDQNDNLASFSNYGSTSVDIAAPGTNILSTVPANAGTASLSVGGTFYAASPLTYSGSNTGFSGNIINCGYGAAGDFPPQVSQQIALIKRGAASGTLFFTDKVTNAMAAGAKAVIIYNNVSGAIFPTLQTPNNWIPSVFISDTDGQEILNTLPGTATLTVPPAYEFMQGTSMATPHVTGAISLAAMNFPNDTVAQRIQRILGNADAKPQLAGKIITGARINLLRSVDADANELPDWWEQIHYGTATGTNPNTDTDHDGMTQYQEFLAGTSPVSPLSRLQVTSMAGPSGTANPTLTWSCIPGKTYRVLRSGDLVSWSSSLPDSRITAQAGQTSLSYTDPTASGVAKRFYRVEVVPP
jgi:subtilisin family serine protease